MISGALDSAKRAQHIENMLISTVLTSPKAVRELLRHPHGRRMLCGILSLEEHLPGDSGFYLGLGCLDTGSAKDFERRIEPIRFLPANLHNILQTPFSKTFSMDGSAMEMFAETAKIKDWAGSFNCLRVTDLSNPFLCEDSLLSLYHASETSTAAKLALIANPNMPQRIRAEHPARGIDPNYMEAVSIHGDLSHKETVYEIVKAVAGRIFADGPNSQMAKNLLQRETLPGEIVVALDCALGQRLHNVLASRPYYRKFVPKPGVGALESIITERSVKLGVDTSAALLTNVYDRLGEVLWRRKTSHPDSGWAAIASHPNAPDELMKRAGVTAMFAGGSSEIRCSRKVRTRKWLYAKFARWHRREINWKRIRS